MFKAFWEKIPASWKYEARSILHTFLAAAVAEWALNGGGIPSSKEALYAVLFAMLRAGIKAVSVLFVPQKNEQAG